MLRENTAKSVLAQNPSDAKFDDLSGAAFGVVVYFQITEGPLPLRIGTAYAPR
jgi:hypothetical protein